MKFKLLSLLTIGAFSLSGYAANWLTDLPGNRPICQLSIPGTHDTGTYGMSGMSKCQTLSIDQQWEAGVRAFDIRACWKSNQLKIYHGSTQSDITVEEALNTIKEKLDANPGEFAIILIKEENGANDGWAAATKEVVDKFASYIATFTPGMTINDARGKMLILARDQFDSAKIPFISPWGDNQTYKTDCKITLGGQQASVYLQDYYAVTYNKQSEKTDAVVAMLDFSTNNHYSPIWVINHTSGYVKTLFGTSSESSIKNNASTENQAMVDYLNDSSKGQGRTGIVLMDYAGDATYGKGLVEALIERNNHVPGLSDNDIVTFFRDKANWTYGGAATGVGTTTQKQAVMIEAYRDNAFGTGTVISSTCSGITDGDYMVTLIAHANWTPGRGSIQTAMCPENGIGYSRLFVNNAEVDLPITHSTGCPAEMHSYMVPVKVTDGTMTIQIKNLRQGANWITCYVQNVAKINGETVVALQDFESNFIGITSTTGAQNQTRKGPSADFFPNSNSYENWISSSTPWTGKMYQKINVPNGRYRINIDLISTKIDGNNTYFYANGYREALRSTSPESYEAVVEVTDRALEFGMGFDSKVANWAGIDNAKVTLLALAGDEIVRDHFADSHHYFASPAHWTKVNGTAGNPGYKDNLFVENWQGSANHPQGTIMTATHSGYTDGEYLVGIYAFACFTGGSPEYEDGLMDFAQLRVNDAIVNIPTHNTGAVPLPHELYYIPCSITDGTLTIDVIGKGYPNWFGIDVANVIPADMSAPNTLYIPQMESYSGTFGHGKNQFVSQMNTSIQNNVIKGSDSTVSPDEPMYENWNGTPYTGRLYSTLYLPIGTYDVSLDCFASGIGNNLDDYYLFANTERTPKTQGSAFETLTTTVTLLPKDYYGKSRREVEVNTVPLQKLEYGFGIDTPASQWVAIKNPGIVLRGDIQTGVDSAEIEHQMADAPVYTITGIKVADSIKALESLPAGIYISNNRKFIVR